MCTKHPLPLTDCANSSHRWVVNTRLPNASTEGHTAYDPSKSSSFKEMKGSRFNITYGDDSYAFGGVGTDTINVGGVTVTGQSIGLPTEVAPSILSDTHSNGLVGLGFSSINTVKPKKQKSFFETVAEVLDEPVLGVSLVSGGVGEFEFGTINKSKFKGDLVNASVDASGGFWKFESPLYRVGDGEMKEHDKATSTIADTGTSLMLLEQIVVDAYYEKVHGAQYATSASGWIYPCSAELPNLSIAVGPQHLATVPGNMINFAEVGTNTTTGEAGMFKTLYPAATFFFYLSASHNLLTIDIHSVLWGRPVQSRSRYANPRRYVPESFLRCLRPAWPIDRLWGSRLI